jgi:hypothetical protein
MANAGLLLFLVLMTLLLVMFIGAIIVAPPQPPGSGTPHNSPATVPPLTLPGRPPPAPPPRPLPTRQPAASAPTAGFNGWSAADQDTSEQGALQPAMHDQIPQPEVPSKPPWELMHDRIPQPQVSGRPPWGPAPKPQSLEEQAAETTRQGTLSFP